MDGWWDCEALDQFFAKILGARLDKKIKKSKRNSGTSVKK
jgi:cyclopropane-fatty-acyl-phospholipid synthase